MEGPHMVLRSANVACADVVRPHLSIPVCRSKRLYDAVFWLGGDEMSLTKPGTAL